MYKRNKTPIVISPEAAEGYRQKLLITRPTALLSYFLLIGLIAYGQYHAEIFNIWVWLVKLLPLLILMPGLIQQKFRSYSWLCFVCLVYFIFIFPVAYDRGFWSDWLIMLATGILFISSMFTSRWLQYYRYHSQAKQ